MSMEKSNIHLIRLGDDGPVPNPTHLPPICMGAYIEKNVKERDFSDIEKGSFGEVGGLRCKDVSPLAHIISYVFVCACMCMLISVCLHVHVVMNLRGGLGHKGLHF